MHGTMQQPDLFDPSIFAPWPLDRENELRRLYGARETITAIATALAVSPMAVKTKIRRLKLKRDRVSFHSLWTDERVEQLTAMWDNGYLINVIADALGITRNAVLGKVHRLNLQPRRGYVRTFTERVRPTINAGAILSAIRAQRKAPKVPARPIRISCIEFDAAIPREHMKQVEALDRGECRWPVGDPGTEGFGFCCAPIDGTGSSYCAEHHHFATRPERSHNRRFILRTVEGRGFA